MSDRIIYRSLVLVVLLAFFLGGYLLENLGIQYVSEGGNPILKVHLYSYLVLAIFLFLCIKIGFFRLSSLLGHDKRRWLVSLLAIAIVIVYGLNRYGTSGMAYLIDSLLIPLLAVPLVLMLSLRDRDRLLTLIAWLLLINSIVALFEFIFQRSVIPVEFSSFAYFRSPAFLNHPLNNALITVSLAPILMSRTKIPTLIYFSITLLALFAFGGRGAMALFIFGSAILSFDSLKKFFTVGVRVSRQRFALMQALFFGTLILVLISIVFTSVGDRILSKLYVDGSAQARFDVFILLEQLSLSEWILGATASFQDNIKFYIGIKTVENYVIGWILKYGALACSLLLIAVYLLPLRQASFTNLNIKVSVMCFTLVSLTNNALMTKTPVLLFLFIVLFCLREKK